MQAADPQTLFARAERAFAAGRLDEASRDLRAIGQSAGDHPAVLHLLALTEKRRGNLSAARGAFARAAELAPDDAALAGNHANLLRELGENDAALALYDRALAADPSLKDVRYNRALLLQTLGRLNDALADLDTLRPRESADAPLHSARGSILRQLERLDEAAAAYDAALRADPKRANALHGRARVGMERGEVGAWVLYTQALAQRPGDLELTLGAAEGLEAEGDPRGIEVLTATVQRVPDWAEGHQVLARMRAEAGHGSAFADHYAPALALHPGNRTLHDSYWHSLANAGRYREALDALRAAKPGLAPDRALQLTEAYLAGEAGLADTARDLLAALDDGLDVLAARGRIALQVGDATAAAGLFETVTAAEPGSISAWAHLDLAWRVLGDSRHDWLSGQSGLFGPHDLGLSDGELGSLARLLRGLHKTRAHPIGQSLRGGTQTRGRLFARREPELARLREAILAALHDHVRALPPFDPRHPLLRHRETPLAIAGSWSVRLSSQGFHVNHIHPQGLLSSACYIALPETLGAEESRAGWLELGRPPAELPLGLEPLAAIAPKPGRLALFPSYLFHGTRPFEAGERLTVAFDVVAR